MSWSDQPYGSVKNTILFSAVAAVYARSVSPHPQPLKLSAPLAPTGERGIARLRRFAMTAVFLCRREVGVGLLLREARKSKLKKSPYS